MIDNAFLDEKADFINEKSVLGLLKFDLNDTTFLDLHARYTTIEAGMSYFQNVSEDTIEDFMGGYDFHEAFIQPFRPKEADACPAKHPVATD